MPIYVIVVDPRAGRPGDDAATAPSLDFSGEAVALSSGLFVCDTQAKRSRLYHDVKAQLPKGTPLFVGELADMPKFKGMADGSTKAARRLFGKT
jgi:hypothetical protein